MQILETVINNYLALDPEAPGKLAKFDGKIICLDISGFPQKFYLLPRADHIKVATVCSDDVDATLKGSPVSLFKMGIMRDVAPLLLQGEVEIIGDMRTGRAFKAFLADLEIDWEEHLSKLTGDVAAHELIRSLHTFTSWGKRSGESLAMDVSEYLTEESRDVVGGAEIEHFCSRVDDLRADVDRLDARINRIEGDRR